MLRRLLCFFGRHLWCYEDPVYRWPRKCVCCGKRVDWPYGAPTQIR
jgi:hypothetical protein